jgi:hypothetical protein
MLKMLAMEDNGMNTRAIYVSCLTLTASSMERRAVAAARDAGQVMKLRRCSDLLPMYLNLFLYSSI